MRIKTQLVIALNVTVVATMAATFAYHIKGHNEQVKKVQAEIQAQVNTAIQEAEENRLAIQSVIEKIEFDKQHNCLAMNVYHEARNDGLTGQRAIAWATMNRVVSEKYPDNICDVVYQAELDENAMPIRNRCQFSWFCDGKSDDIEDQAAWQVAEQIAEQVMNAYGKETDPTNGAIMYHADYVDPFWVSSYTETARIDSHIFYN